MLNAKIIRGDIAHQPLLIGFPGLPELGQACEKAGIPLFGLSGAPHPAVEHHVTIDQLRKIGYTL